MKQVEGRARREDEGTTYHYMACAHAVLTCVVAHHSCPQVEHAQLGLRPWLFHLFILSVARCPFFMHSSPSTYSGDSAIVHGLVAMNFMSRSLLAFSNEFWKITILFKSIARKKLLFSNYLGRYSYSFRARQALISVTVTVLWV